MTQRFLFLGTVLGVLALDQWTKAWVIGHMTLHQTIEIVPRFFYLGYVRNPGAAFGFLAGASPGFRSVFFVLISFLAILLILYYVRKTLKDDCFQTLSLALILAGAIGNLIDRIRFDSVVDFLEFHLGSFQWPNFNVADSAITVGAIGLILSLFRRDREPRGGTVR